MALRNDFYQVGSSATPANNFVLQTDAVGGFKLSRGVLLAGGIPSTSQDILKVDASGNVSIEGGSLSVPNEPSWTVVSAAVSPASGGFGSATGSVAYKKIGRLVFFRAAITITSNGTGAGQVLMTMPFAGAGVEQTFIGREGQVGGFPIMVWLRGNQLSIYKLDTTYPGGNGFVLYTSGSYEATS